MRISDWSSDVCSSDLHALVGLEGRAGPGDDDLPLATLDGRELHILPQIILQHDIRDGAVHRHQVGDVDEFAEPGDRLVAAARLEFELGARIPESGGPGIELVQTRSEEHTSELQSLMRLSYAVF